VIDLMLKAHGKQVVSMNLKVLAVLILGFHPDLAGTLNKIKNLREAQTAFLPFQHTLFFRDYRIDECELLIVPPFGSVILRLTCMWNLNRYHATQVTDLICRQPDAVRVFHGLMHIRDKPAQMVIKYCDFLSGGLKNFRGPFNDF
jgi:hypothetical protein